MKITLTGINFEYTNGYDSDYTAVRLNFNNTGATFNLSGYITATKDEYATVAGDPLQIIALIKQKVVESVQA